MIESEPTQEGPSKSQLKREMSALQELGEKLTSITNTMREKCGLPDPLENAIEEFNRLPKKHGARRRQLQYIGKLMRALPDDVLQRIQGQLNQNVELDKKRFHALEDVRDNLLTGSKDALDAVINQFPDADIQQIRQLIRQAQKELELDQPPAGSRKLFRLLRTLQAGQGS